MFQKKTERLHTLVIDMEKKISCWKKRTSQGLCGRCGVNPILRAGRCLVCFDKTIDEQRIRNGKLKAQIYAHYGDACKCCGEKELCFLSIDHINNNGSQHRREVGSGLTWYKWIIRNNYPDDLQLLCMNCQWGRRIHGVCPHQRKKS